MKRIGLFVFLLVGVIRTADAQLLWRITDPLSGRVSFLFGTMHLANYRYLDEHPAVYDSMQACKTIVAEVDLTDKSAMFNFMSFAGMPDSMKLQDGLTGKEWKILDSLLGLLDPPSEAAVYNSFKPAYVETVLAQDMFRRHYSGLIYERMVPIDQGIVNIGYRDGYRMEFLESAAEQLDLVFVRPPLTIQFSSLKRMLNGDDDSATRVYMNTSLQLPRLYEEKKLDSISAIIDMSLTGDSAEKEMLTYLLIDRNKAWLQKLDMWLPNGGYFIAVGAGHLVRDYGLIAGLRKRGYRVEPVIYR